MKRAIISLLARLLRPVLAEALRLEGARRASVNAGELARRLHAEILKIDRRRNDGATSDGPNAEWREVVAQIAAEQASAKALLLSAKKTERLRFRRREDRCSTCLQCSRRASFRLRIGRAGAHA